MPDLAISQVVDQSYMRRAISLAEKGCFTTTPNPNVGCVIINQQRVVGEGFHYQAGTPHAEVHALKQAGDLARGSTAYVTLEPCSHHGRTPPCADALIAAGVNRVVVASVDPNPKVSGRGIERLRKAGIQVDVGILAEQADALNKGFFSRMRKGRPYVTVKMASSLDGRTALKNGKSQWITGADARADVHYHRAQSCVILSGADTVLTDNAVLTARIDSTKVYPEALQNSPMRQPVRVIIDGSNRLRRDIAFFEQDVPSIIVNKEFNPHLSDANEQGLIEQWQIPSASHKIDLSALMSRLAKSNYNSIWVEAGAQLTGALIQQKLVDEIIIYQAPKLMGNVARPLFNLPEFERMEDVIGLTLLDVFTVGQDVKLVYKLTST